MKLRWFSMCDKNGKWTEPILQVCYIGTNLWIDIPVVTCKAWEEEEYTHNEKYDYNN